MGVDCIDVLYQTLSLGLPSRSIESPDNECSALLKPADDLYSYPIDGSFDSTNHLGAVAPNRDSLSKHGCCRYHDFSCSPDVELY